MSAKNHIPNCREDPENLRQAGLQGVDFGFRKNLDPVLPQKRGRHACTGMLPAGERAVVDEAAAAGRATVDQKGKPATVLARQVQGRVRTGDVKVGYVRAGRLDDARVI